MIEALKTFQNCISHDLDDNTRMVFVGDQVGKGDADAGVFNRAHLSQSGKLTQAEENNNIRTALLDALAEEFKSKGGIPASIKSALKGSSLLGGSDMSTGKDGKVDSGRPLTMRRIKAIMTAVQNELKEEEETGEPNDTSVATSIKDKEEEETGGPNYTSVATFIKGKGYKEDYTDESDYVPHYGFSGVRDTAEKDVEAYEGEVDDAENNSGEANFQGFKADLTRIDTMNYKIGLNFYETQDPSALDNGTLKISNYSQHLSSAMKPSNVADNADKLKYNLMLEGWKSYLTENRANLDVFSRIKTFQEEAAAGKDSGWAGIAKRDGLQKALQQMVWKNLPANSYKTMNDDDVAFFAKTLESLSEVEEKEDVDRDSVRNDRFEKALDEYCTKTGRNANDLRDIFNTMLSVMFFRRTSKLGLDFFAKNKMQVAFEWTDHTGAPLKSTSKNDIENDVDPELSSKWWKEDDPSSKGQKHHGATITFSEMRHVLKKDMIDKHQVEPVVPKRP